MVVGCGRGDVPKYVGEGVASRIPPGKSGRTHRLVYSIFCVFLGKKKLIVMHPECVHIQGTSDF